MKRLVAWVLALQLFSSASATAADSSVPKDPLNYPLKQYGFMLGIALAGGIVSYITKVKKGEAQAWNVMQLIGELATSAFAGLICFWVCEGFNVPQAMTAALVGIAGHMGGKAIAAFETMAQKRWGGEPPKE